MIYVLNEGNTSHLFYPILKVNCHCLGDPWKKSMHILVSSPTTFVVQCGGLWLFVHVRIGLFLFIFLTNYLWVPISDKNKLSYPNWTQEGHLWICVTTWVVPCWWRSWLCGWHSECRCGWYECRPRSRAEIQSWDATCYKLGHGCEKLCHNM